MSVDDNVFSTILIELGRALTALAPYHDDLVVVGGMAPLLYREHPEYGTYLVPLATTEADISLPTRLSRRSEGSISELLHQAGFVAFEVQGFDHRELKVQHFQDERHGTAKPASTYIEFLTPLRGRGESFVLEPQGGLRAQAARYLDLLGHESLTIDLQLAEKLSINQPCTVRIPHPWMYILQKVLARRSGRGINKQAKDMAYVYDVVLLTRKGWSDFTNVFQSACEYRDEWASWLKKGRRHLDELFATETSDGVIEAARVYRNALGEGAPSEQSIYKLMRRFIEITE